MEKLIEISEKDLCEFCACFNGECKECPYIEPCEYFVYLNEWTPKMYTNNGKYFLDEPNKIWSSDWSSYNF